MTFFGYTNESEMRAANPQIADHLIQIATWRTIRACTPGRECLGSIAGMFFYADGTTDEGRDKTIFRTEFQNAVFQWSGETTTTEQ